MSIRRGANSSLDSAAWPLAARAQQGNRVRRIGVLMSLAENDPEVKRRHSASAWADLLRPDFRPDW